MYIYTYIHKYIYIYIYIYIYQGRIQDFRKGGVRLSILNRRRRRLSENEAPKAPRGRGVGRGALPTRLEGLGERRELPQRGPGQSPKSF